MRKKDLEQDQNTNAKQHLVNVPPDNGVLDQQPLGKLNLKEGAAPWAKTPCTEPAPPTTLRKFIDKLAEIGLKHATALYDNRAAMMNQEISTLEALRDLAVMLDGINKANNFNRHIGS